MFKNKTRLALKLFGLVWFVLVIQIVLKLTFNYWQPYVIPTSQLQAISDFVDNNVWIINITDFILYIINGLLMVLCGLQQWCFKDKKQYIIFFSIIIAFNILYFIPFFRDFTSIIFPIAVPLILNYKKWITILLTSVLNFIFLALSVWLSNISNTSQLPYIIKLLFNLDYYIMLVLNYFVFNFIRVYKIKLFKRKEMKNNG